MGQRRSPGRCPPLTVPHQPGSQASTEPAPPECKFYFPTNDLRCLGPQATPPGQTSAWPGDAPRGPAGSGLQPGSDEMTRDPILPRCPALALACPPAAAAPLAAAAACSLPSCPRAHSFRVDQSPHVRFIPWLRLPPALLPAQRLQLLQALRHRAQDSPHLLDSLLQGSRQLREAQGL